MAFKVLFLQEHQVDDVSTIDNRMFILYDEKEGSFYYYGLRNKRNMEYYEGSFHYTRLGTLADFIKYTFNNLVEVLTHEMHSVKIYSYEYNTINFSKLHEKISKSTEIVGYDSDKLSYDDLCNILNMMVTHEV
jgi:hypothetical protein